jgi:hypothetical protein
VTPKQTILPTLGRYLAAVLIIALASPIRALFKYTHQLHNFCSICEADMLKKPDQRYLTALQPGQPAFLQKALKVKCTVMCIRIKFYRFGGFFSISTSLFMQRLGTPSSCRP